MESTNKTVRDPKLEEDIKIIRAWLEKQPHMPQNIDDELLLPYINGTKSIEIAKQKLENFCVLHQKHPDSFNFPFRDPLDPKFKESCKMGKMFMLPTTTPEGYRVYMTMSTDFNKFDGFRSNVLMSMVLEASMLMYPDNGNLVLLFDCNNVDSSIMTKMGVGPITFFLQYLQSSIPMKLKKMIVYNMPSFFDIFINTFVKPYAKKKIFDRILFYSKGSEVLKEHLPVEMLPCDIPGGKAPSTDELYDEWLKIIESKRDWFMKSQALATDETKRLPDNTQTYGVNGTFRMLSVD